MSSAARPVVCSDPEGSVAPWRALVIDYHLMASDLVDLFAGSGALVQRIYPRTLSVASFRRLCSELKPHLVFGINFAAPIAALCSAFRIPYVSWSIDPLPSNRIELLDATDPEYCLAFVHRRRLIDRLQRVGLRDVRWLPLAAAARRAPVHDEQRLAPYRCALSFVGGSLETEHQALRSQLSAWGVDGARQARLDEYLREMLAASGGDPDFMGFDEDAGNLPEEFSSWVPRPELVPAWIDLLNGRLSNLYRVERVRSLDALGVDVYGDEGWAPHVRNYKGLARHGDELTCIYNASRINLDVPRIYQRDIVTLRVFDILATSGFLLSERSEDLSALFGDGGFLGAYSPSESLERKVTDLRAAPERCREIAKAGQREVLERHLLSHRFDVLISACRERGWL